MGFHSRKQLSSQQRFFVDAPLPWGKPVVDAVPYPPDPLTVDRQKIEPFSSYNVYFFLVGGVTLLLCLLAIILFSKWRNARRTRSSPIFFGAQEDYLGKDEGPEIEHPIWYINTVGLHQVLIDSITVFQYMKDERLTEGTEYSVCLSEFQEDESLRLLPKCSHAFHLPCIDTWLSSHKNCPLCRAPIVYDRFYAQIALPELNLSSTDSTSREEPQMGNLVNHGGLIISYQFGEDGTSEVRDEDDMARVSSIGDQAHPANPDMILTESVLRNDSEVQGVLFSNNSREAEVEMVPMRRSVSLDDSSASAIYNVLANVAPGKEGNSDFLLVLQKSLRSKNVMKRGDSGTVSIGKLMSSSLQKGPISMKRSFSSSWKRSSSSRYNRSKSSVHSIEHICSKNVNENYLITSSNA